MELRELTGRIEYISAGYADLHDVDRTDEWILLKLTEEVGELVQAHLTSSGQGRDRGTSPDEQRRATEDELADVLGMCLVFAHSQGIDLDEVIERKWLQHEQNHRERGFGGTAGARG